MRIILLAAAISFSAVAADSVTLARDGRALADIVIAEDAGKTAASAAADLGTYLTRITGAKFAIRKESAVRDPARPLIVVGQCKLAASAGIDAAKLRPEGFTIRTTGSRLFIVGADKGPKDAGTWYGVSDFLEKELGVRWLWPGELGTVVPEKRNLTVGPLDRTDAPALHMRRIRDGIANRNPVKLGRGAKELDMDPRKHEQMIEASRVWTSHLKLGENVQANYGHGFTHWWADYHQQHPDWFAMMPDGSRQWPWTNFDRVKMCVSNRAVQQQWMQNAREAFRENPDLISFSASANDNVFQGNCVCPECEKWDDPNGEKYTMNWRAGGKDVVREHVSLTDRYVHFYNLLADMLARELRGKMVGGYAYGSWKNPPVHERNLRENILLGYVGFNDIYISNESRAKDLGQWDEWASLAKHLFYRPNILHTGHGMPLVFVHKLAADIQHRADRNLMGTDFDSLVHHWSTQGINYYVLAKLLWNPHLDVDALLADYCRSAFGPAAAQMTQYYLDIEKRTDWIAARYASEQGEKTRFFTVIPEFYTPAVLNQWRAQLDKALQTVPPDSVYAKRIRWTSLGIDYASLTAKTLAADAQSKGKLARERDAWYRAHLYDWSVFPPLLRWREPAKLFGW